MQNKIKILIPSRFKIYLMIPQHRYMITALLQNNTGNSQRKTELCPHIVHCYLELKKIK